MDCRRTVRFPPVAACGSLRRLAVCALALPCGSAFAETTHTIALFPSALDAVRQGFARVINHSVDVGDIRIVAIDDAGRRTEPVTLAIDPRETIHFNSDDLESGNESKGLSGGVGSGEGDWRLELSSDLDIEVLAYIRTTDGFLTSMHDTVPLVDNRHEVAIFNPASNRDQVSRLRLGNPGESAATVTITGVDSVGAAPGSAVEASIEAGASHRRRLDELPSRLRA